MKPAGGQKDRKPETASPRSRGRGTPTRGGIFEARRLKSGAWSGWRGGQRGGRPREVSPRFEIVVGKQRARGVVWCGGGVEGGGGCLPHQHKNTFFFSPSHIYFPASGQAMVSGVAPFPPQFLPSIFVLSRIGFSNPTARRSFIECC